MKNPIAIAIATLPLFIAACSTPKPPVAFHATDSNAVVIKSVDGTTTQLLGANATAPLTSQQAMTKVSALTGHQTAVVILENYDEAQVGEQFRDRSTPWFLGLRTLGYDHIVFLKGQGTDNPEGLATLARYD